MLRSCNAYCFGKDTERGAVIPLAVFLIVTLLALAGLAIDAGNLYRAKIQFQKAADAGALAGIASAIIRTDAPSDANALKTFIETRGTEVTCENLRIFGYSCPANEITVQAEYDLASATLSVDVDADVFFLLMGMVPFEIIGTGNAGSSDNVAASASVRRQTANVALVLDVSSSMQCPSTGTCNCLTVNRTQTCPEEAAAQSTNQKIDELRSAVATFVSRFDETRDRITLVPFNIAANVEVPLRPAAALGFTPSDFNVLNTIVPRSNTNVCDAYMTAFREMNDKGLIGNEDIAYLYFSDGAPTAGRFLFATPQADLEENNPDGFGTHDYLHYTVEWVDGGTHWSGPSLLTRTGAISRDYSNPDPPPPGTPGLSVPTCSPSYTTPPSASGSYNSVFENCLSCMAFHLPFDPGTQYGNDIDSSGARTYQTHWQHQYYHCAIAMSDFLRSNGGMVYTLGLGPSLDLSTAISGNDPYQGITDKWARKDLFLTRTANDYLEAVPVSQENYSANHPEFSYPGYTPYSTLYQESPQRFGRYFPSPSAEQLDNVFASAGQKILLRLIE